MKILNKKQLLIVGTTILLGATVAIAYNGVFKARGLYGMLEYTFLNEKTDSPTMSTSTHIQRYQVGYENYYYSPNLITYDVSGGLYFNNSSATSIANQTRKSDIQDFNYRAYLNVIQGSKYPFTVFIEKVDTPVLSLLSLGNSLSAQDIFKYGLYGSLLVKDYTIQYNFYNSSMNNTNFTANENRDDSSYSVKLYRNLEKAYYALSFNHNIISYVRTNINTRKVSQWSDTYSEVRADLNWTPNKFFNTRSYLKYYSNDRFNMKASAIGLDAYWHPSLKYTASFGTLAQSLKYQASSSDTLTIYGSGNYRITPNLTTSHGFTLFDLSGDTYKQNSGSVKFGLAYNNQLSDTASYYINSETEIKADRGSSGKEFNILDDLTLNRNSVSYGLGAGFSKRVEGINSNINFNTQYYGYHSDIGEDVGRFTLSSAFITRFNPNFTFSLKGSYSRVIQTFQNKQMTTYSDIDREYFTISQRINYNTMLGYNGRLNTSVGLNYFKSGISQRVYADANIGFKYRILRGMIFKSTARASSDLLSDSIEYRTFIGLDYIIRQTTLTSGMRYQNRLNDYNNGYGRQNVYVQIRRIF